MDGKEDNRGFPPYLVNVMLLYAYSHFVHKDHIPPFMPVPSLSSGSMGNMLYAFNIFHYPDFYD